MAVRASLFFLFLLLCSLLAAALYEDQVGIADWHQKYIGKTKQAVFHTQKAGRKRVVVATEENVIASLDLRSGDIYWRHVLGKNDPVDQIGITLGKYVVTLSSEGSVLRAWNLPDGQMSWETSLEVLKPSKSLLYVPANAGVEKDNLILVYGGGCLHAISSVDGEVAWKKEFSLEGFNVQGISQPLGGSIIYIVGFTSNSQVVVNKVNAKTGELLNHNSVAYPRGLSGEALQVSSDLLVALDAARSSLVTINFQASDISFHHMAISNLVQKSFVTVSLLPLNVNGMFAAKVDSTVVIARVKDTGELKVTEKINDPSCVSDAILLTEGQEAFAMVQHADNRIHLSIRVNNDIATEILKESISVDPQRGHAQKIFINNYVRTDRSHGFRALIVMEDHSLLLVQQGAIVWSREDGLASIVDSTVSELPVEKVGVSVAKVEENLLEWLKGHMLKLKGTLMLASAEDVATIQGMRLKNSEKNKMTRDHNGFRKLVIVLTKAGKVLALHTGDGRIIWSVLLPSLRESDVCDSPIALNIYQWHVPHHHAMDENPSLLIVGKCGQSSDAPGVLSVVDSYTGKELNSIMLAHSIAQVIPLPFTDSNEQRLHLIIDRNSYGHLYPRTPDSINIFLREMSSIYWYSVDAEKSMIRGHALKGKCDLDSADEYCFSSKELWSIIFPSESEKIATIATRKMNEVVHTQAKVNVDHDVMYKYISKNMVFAATVSPKASGEIGSATPEEASLVAYLIDAVTGRILHRVTHQGAQGPIHAVVSENWVVYHYFNLRAHRYEMSVIEIYDQSRAVNKDVWKLILGKHNLTSPITSYSRPEVVVKTQTYFFTHSVKAVAVTATAKGITSKQVLIGTIGDQVLALDKRFLDPRRTLNPSQAEKEEGIIPLTDTLPIIPQSYSTHSHQVEGLRDIVTIPTKLESTTLVFSYGVDLFFTRIAPSRTYDSLTEDFSYALLLITIIALVAAIIVTWILSEKKELREKWR
ncbi:Quinoprotein alcohol dehydrogenase-like protein [Dioscorea alata]|uniref:Quinoprotein alcohol dehydrogenase-like protein n=1 Tax=Dioscorea alata TaxID=55571 RepID=A0ACB7UDG9_DIOAL|nr:Quinoprotein alcohol dehydrogenase-like protein [Dioscorea alata]